MTGSVDETTVGDGGTSGWTTAESTDTSLLSAIHFALVGVASGLVGGMGGFMFSQYVLMPTVPFVGPRTWALAVTALGGSFAFFLSRDARESAKAMIVGLGVGLLVLVLTRVGPIWLLFPAAAWGPLIRIQLEPVARTVLIMLIVVYWGGYLTALLLWGYFRS